MGRRRTSGRRWQPLGLAALLWVLAACGSTVPTGTGGQGLAPTGGSDGGLTPPGAAVGDNQLGGSGPGGESGAGAPSGPAEGPGGQASAGGRGTPSTSTGGLGQSGRGTSASGPLSPAVVKIGLTHSKNANSFLSAAGSNDGIGDVKQLNEAVLAHINRNGGIAGRKAVGAYHDVDVTAPSAVQSQAACAQWTEDDRVTLALPQIVTMDSNLLRECLRRANVPAMSEVLYSTVAASAFAQTPLYAELNTTSVESLARTYVRGLASQGFFKGGKVGVVFYEKEPFPSVLDRVLIPELRRLGVTVAARHGHSMTSPSDLSEGSTQMSSAVLSFRQAGVNRVLFFETWIGYTTFLHNAQSQQYKPIYGFNSNQAPYANLELGLLPESQLEGSRLVSWYPLGDTKASARYEGGRMRLCNSIYRRAGITPATDTLGRITQSQVCESLLLVQDAYRGAGRQLQPSDLVAGLQRVGPNAQQASRRFASFGPDKRWGTAKFWNARFDASRKDFVYDNGPHDMQ